MSRARLSNDRVNFGKGLGRVDACTCVYTPRKPWSSSFCRKNHTARFKELLLPYTHRLHVYSLYGCARCRHFDHRPCLCQTILVIYTHVRDQSVVRSYIYTDTFHCARIGIEVYYLAPLLRDCARALSWIEIIISNDRINFQSVRARKTPTRCHQQGNGFDFISCLTFSDVHFILKSIVVIATKIQSFQEEMTTPFDSRVSRCRVVLSEEKGFEVIPLCVNIYIFIYISLIRTHICYTTDRYFDGESNEKESYLETDWRMNKCQKSRGIPRVYVCRTKALSISSD